VKSDERVKTDRRDALKLARNYRAGGRKELHEPDRMYLNPNQIVFVESVGPNSKVAQLIDEQKNK
jgi:hypothetical protein